MDTQSKREVTLDQMTQSMLTGMKIIYKPMIDNDDMYNLDVELSSEISKLEFGKANLEKKLDQVTLEKKAIQRQTGSEHINPATASMQGLEVLMSQLAGKDKMISNYQYSIDLKTVMIDAKKQFYFDVIGKAYVKFVSKNKTTKTFKTMSKPTEAQLWLHENNHKLDPVIYDNVLI